MIKQAKTAPARRPLTVALPRRRSDAFPLAVFRRQKSKAVHSDATHAHHFFSMLYVERGSGSVRLGQKTLHLKPGDVHLVMPGVAHDTRGIPDVEGWVLEFTADLFADTASGANPAMRWLGFQRLGGLAQGKIRVPSAQRPLLAARLANLHHELHQQGPAYQLAARAQLTLLLIDLARLLGPDALPASFSPLVEEVFAVIDARFAETLSLSRVARAVSRSPSHVTAAVRRQTGFTVLQWIAERRLYEARRRLRESDEDIAIVAERIGYGSVDHFIRQFRRAHGLTPAAWRRSLTL